MMADRNGRSRVYEGMNRRFATALLCVAISACGGSSKPATTTPAGSGSGSSNDPQAMNSSGDTSGGVATGSSASGDAQSGSSTGSGMASVGGPTAPPEVPIVFPNQDPDPAQAKAQVDAHLIIARQALSAPTPDGDTALREAKEALKIDAANIDAAAMVAFAYYHKKQYDTSELVLDELFKRPAAKQNANVYYVYGVLYDHTNRPEQAVLAFQKAVELDPKLGGALVDVGVHQLENKQYAQAQDTFKKLTQPPFSRSDATTMTALGSAYRGRSADYAPGSGDRNQYIQLAEASYKRAVQTDPNYGPAYYDLGLLYLDSDPFPSGSGTLDNLQRLNAAKGFFDNYQKVPGFDIKLYDERMKDVTKALKKAQKAAKKKGGSP
jgi:tetratricopeptide (TPR) repeat protein